MMNQAWEDAFQELWNHAAHHRGVREAVADRLRTDRVGILLSGGLDSSSVAAVARELSSKGGQATDIRGYTSVYESSIPDRDGEYAREVGEFLRIPIKFTVADQVQLFDGWDDPELSLPEPDVRQRQLGVSIGQMKRACRKSIAVATESGANGTSNCN